ncbi:glycosyltransferase family 2 protein [Caballeronia sp. LZ062]|uniref:glycosyltransferase family 2 protein n=1 Tax=unclassified Caballeronia TaxID=2646786 RepID=UPI002864588B|nr:MULTISPECIES: glycosyltransferase family 2 protein [unclassified Caballeronia]MDR5855199.1 glycosyltransferase family 2 protein [Caballeronia sp. LZ050]MDR5870271.1 glycosyltransferase family 2 protein [Caballeronia sp. LZ062]
MTNVIVTMGGLGKRFRDVGYTVPKYRIEAHGKTLFTWSMLSLRSFVEAGARFVFIVRAEDQAREFIESEAQRLGIAERSVIEIDHLTDGQATTAILAQEAIADPAQPMLVYNIDTFVHPDALPASAVRGDGWVPCFPGKGDGWSFAAADSTGRVSELREKVRISPHATVGLYWFSSFALYRSAYERYYSDSSRMEKGEKYIAPLYNELIANGHPVYLHEVPEDAVIPLGTPAEVEAFLRAVPPSL